MSVGWLQAWNQAYPGAAQHLQNAGAQPRLTRQPNPAWGLALAAVGVAGAGAGYAAWRSHQMWKACAPSTDLIPDGWLTATGKLNPIAQQAVVQLFPILYEVEEIKGARELAWAAVRKLAGSDECPEDPPLLLVGRMRTVMSTATDMASEFVNAMERVGNPMTANKERFKNGACFPGVETAIGLDPGTYGTRQYNPHAQDNPMMPIFRRATNNYRSHPDYQRSRGWVRRRNQAGTIGPALGLSPFVYGQPGPWAPPLALQPHFPANNPGPDARGAVSRLGNPTYRERKRTNPPTAIDFRPSQDSPWIPSPGYGTGEYGRQYAPNRTPFPGLPQNAPAVPPNMLVGPTNTIVVGARAEPIQDDVSVGSKSARLARNMWGAMASCSGGKKTCGKSLDFRDPSSMMSHAQGGRQPNPQPAYPQQAPYVPYYPAQMPVAVAGRGGGTRLFSSRWNTAFGGGA